MTERQWDELIAYDQLYGLGTTRPLIEYMRYMLLRLLAAQGVELSEDDNLDPRPKPLDPDELDLHRRLSLWLDHSETS